LSQHPGSADCPCSKLLLQPLYLLSKDGAFKALQPTGVELLPQLIDLLLDLFKNKTTAMRIDTTACSPSIRENAATRTTRQGSQGACRATTWARQCSGSILTVCSRSPWTVRGVDAADESRQLSSDSDAPRERAALPVDSSTHLRTPSAADVVASSASSLAATAEANSGDRTIGGQPPEGRGCGEASGDAPSEYSSFWKMLRGGSERIGVLPDDGARSAELLCARTVHDDVLG
jgi:hypothetical protein